MVIACSHLPGAIWLDKKHLNTPSISLSGKRRGHLGWVGLWVIWQEQQRKPSDATETSHSLFNTVAGGHASSKPARMERRVAIYLTYESADMNGVHLEFDRTVNSGLSDAAEINVCFTLSGTSVSDLFCHHWSVIFYFIFVAVIDNNVYDLFPQVGKHM